VWLPSIGVGPVHFTVGFAGKFRITLAPAARSGVTILGCTICAQDGFIFWDR